jgi:hypothetical protein
VKVRVGSISELHQLLILENTVLPRTTQLGHSVTNKTAPEGADFLELLSRLPAGLLLIPS